jgi:N-acetylmuramoyl-L-alanine amidase
MRRLLILALLFTPQLALAQRSIVIDAGHGGTDPGGTGNALQEKNIVLDVTKRFKALLDADAADTAGGGNWTSHLTRSDDTFISLSARSAYSNNIGADRFMSIHANAFSDPAANGTETFSFASTGTGANLRNIVQAEMLAAWKLTNRGNKTANFAVLRDTACPAELHELSFITNKADAAHLASATERQKAAVAHLRAIQQHFGLEPYVPGTPPVDEAGDIAGHVVDANGPLEGATVTLDTGEVATTDADGAFAFATVKAGTRVATASADFHVPRMIDVAVAAGAQAQAEITLELDPIDPPPEPTSESGCSAGRDAGGVVLLALGLAVLGARRRRTR